MPEFAPLRNWLVPWWIMSGTNSPEAVKKLLENMQSDLRALSLECKKKFPPVKEVSCGPCQEKALSARKVLWGRSPPLHSRVLSG